MDEDGSLWGIGLNSSAVYKQDITDCTKWVLIGKDDLAQMSVCCGRVYCVTKQNEGFTKKGLHGKWKKVDTNLVYLTGDEEGNIWGIGK